MKGRLMEELIHLEELRTSFIYPDYVHKAVDGVSFSIREGRSLGIVGESGSGKSITSLSIIRLLPRHGHIVSGTITFAGRDIRALSERDMRTLRGRDIAMIFQDPLTALNPVLTVGAQIAENILMHEKVTTREARERTCSLMEMVRIPYGHKRIKDYPHQFSGGMRQRVMIAMALACNPRFLIADEPTTALDVTIQAQIMELIGTLTRERNMSMLLITHNLGIVKRVCEEVAVMYMGTVVESSATEDLFLNPCHPYTQGLLSSIPRLKREGAERLHPIPGHPPSPRMRPEGCVFHTRCQRKIENCCNRQVPPEIEVEKGHRVKCLLYA
jgi:oligopeptide/dipeptide ABC transporter ATP-binding protein